MAKSSKLEDLSGWIIGIVFYGGLAFWAVSSLGGSSNSSYESTQPANFESTQQEESLDYQDDEYYSGDDCDPNYSGCVPDVEYDLDCSDIQEEVEVYGDDPHGFDRDGDGYGCESYN